MKREREGKEKVVEEKKEEEGEEKRMKSKRRKGRINSGREGRRCQKPGNQNSPTNKEAKIDKKDVRNDGEDS